MGSHYKSITPAQLELIQLSHVFFVATVDPTLEAGPHGIGPVNVSPKGATPLHILSPNRVAFINYSGSGNETARHIALGSPVTLMVCSFDENAAIVRLYGRATAEPLKTSPLRDQLFAEIDEDLRHGRQVIDVQVESTATSCGYGVPIMALVRDREASDRGRKYKVEPEEVG